MSIRLSEQHGVNPSVTKHPLQEILETLDSDQYKVRSYAGRGMRQRECLAVTVAEGGDVLGLAADVIAQLGNVDTGPTEHEEVSEAFSNARVDSLGKGTVIYFPDVEYVD